MRCTCVSTQMFFRLLNDRISTRFAVLRPTPGSVSSSSIVAGTRPPKRSTRIRQVSLHVRGLVPIEADRDKISFSIRCSVSLAIVRGVRATRNSRADAAAVTASRVCADSIVAISTSKRILAGCLGDLSRPPADRGGRSRAPARA